MLEKHSPIREIPESPFNDLIERASLAIHFDPDLSPAAKFGLSKEVLGIGRLSSYLDVWQERYTERLLIHLTNIYRLSPNILNIILQDLSQWSLLPKEFNQHFLENQGNPTPIIIQKT